MRDFAEAARLALTKHEAGGERFIISKDPFAWQQWGTFFLTATLSLDLHAGSPPMHNSADSTPFVGKIQDGGRVGRCGADI